MYQADVDLCLLRQFYCAADRDALKHRQCSWILPNSIKDQQRGLNQVKQTFRNKARWATSTAANHQKTHAWLKGQTKFSNRGYRNRENEY